MAVRRSNRKKKVSPRKRKKSIPSRKSRKNKAVKRKKAAARPRRRPPLKRKAIPKRRIPKRKTIKQRKKVRKMAPRPRKALLGKKQLKKKVEEPLPRKPTEEERREMRKTIAILSDAYVRQTLIEIGGENALAIIRNFYGNNSDEELAKKLKIKISDVRATLNKLHNEGLVNYIREKDSETGWYSYSWSLNHERMKRWATSQVDRLSILGNGSGEDHYFCPTCGAATITNFESAADGDFRCERCNRLLEFVDERRITELHEKRRP